MHPKRPKMRIITWATLRDFGAKEPTATKGLQFWYKKITSQHWANSTEIIQQFPDADTVGEGRIIFNIKHNVFRLEVRFRYDLQIGYVLFIGTHKEYDKLNF